MQKWSDLGLEDFLASNPKMRLKAYSGSRVVIEGVYGFHAQMDGYPAIRDEFAIRMELPGGYPRDIPKVYETEGRIQKDIDFHTYDDGSFCLGSELRLKALIAARPCIPDFAERVIDHFLYGVCHKQLYGSVPYGELSHGEAGLIDDYQSFFEVSGKKAVLDVLNALGKRKRVANKLPCPCGCGDRLGKCGFRFKLNPWRAIARRRWFREHLRSDFTALPLPEQGARKKRRKRKRATRYTKHSPGVSTVLGEVHVA